MKVLFFLALAANLSACVGSFGLLPHMTPAENQNFAPEAPVVILSERREYIYAESGKGRVNFHKALLVRQPEALATANMALYGKRENIHDLTAATHLPDGTRIMFNQDDIWAAPYYKPAGANTDVQYLTMVPFQKVVPGSVIELSYSVTTPHWVPVIDFELPENTPIRFAEVSVSAPDFVKFQSTSGAGNWTMSQDRWSLREHPAQKHVRPQIRLSWDYLGYSKAYAHTLVFGEWGYAAGMFWKNWAKGAEGLSVPPELLKEAAPEQVAKEVTGWIQTYIAERNSAHDERSIPMIVQSRLGNQMEQSWLLFVFLYKIAQHHAKPVYPSLILVDRGGDPLVTPTALDTLDLHVLVAVPVGNKTLYFDPTCYGCTPDQVEPYLRGRVGLQLSMVAPGKVRYAEGRGKYPESVPDLTIRRVTLPTQFTPQEARYDLALTPRGILIKNGEILFSGQKAEAIKVALRRRALPTKGDDVLAKQYLDQWADGEKVWHLGETTVTLKLQDLIFSRSGFTHSGGIFSSSLGQLFEEDVITALAEPGQARVWFDGDESYRREVHLDLGANAQTVNFPKNQILESPWGRYALRVDIDKQGITLVETLMISPGVVPSTARPQLIEWIRKIQALRQEPFTLIEAPSAVVSQR